MGQEHFPGNQTSLCPLGQARLAADWFDKLGYMLPRGVNQAEFFLDLASGEISTRKVNGEEARLHCIACAEKFLAENLEGFTNGNELCEANFGEELWNAAEVSSILHIQLWRKFLDLESFESYK